MKIGKLQIALAVSVALNLFAVGAGVAAWTGIKRHEARVAEMRAPAQRGPLREILAQMDPAVRDRVRAAMRASALAAKPDFEAARAARRQAVALAAAPTLDSASVTAALDASRAAELRGRARVEADAVALLATLEPADRAAMSQILKRRGRDDGNRQGRQPRDGDGDDKARPN
ncbi:MAG: periplasmic heavy metal sensor [Brevundimonas sp.]|uniref:periplasmic heavy metal sensor n=1 Tax=Brevundimonas sp. TaxID=1871086 RepID=UPI0040342645